MARLFVPLVTLGDSDVISSLPSVPASYSVRHDAGQWNLNSLQHLQSDRRSGAIALSFS